MLFNGVDLEQLIGDDSHLHVTVFERGPWPAIA
jgi:hypothetical protein